MFNLHFRLAVALKSCGVLRSGAYRRTVISSAAVTGFTDRVVGVQVDSALLETDGFKALYFQAVETQALSTRGRPDDVNPAPPYRVSRPLSVTQICGTGVGRSVTTRSTGTL